MGSLAITRETRTFWSEIRRRRREVIVHRFACPACEYNRLFNTGKQAVSMRRVHVTRVHPELHRQLAEELIRGG